MEFYELFEKAAGFIPEGYSNVRAVVENFFPWLLIISTAATCFFGHAVHKLWNYVLFFSIGLFTTFIVLTLIIRNEKADSLIFIISLAAGALASYYSKNLHKTKLFLSTAFIVMVSLPGYLPFLNDMLAFLISIAAGIAAGILSIRYKYIVVIVTTAFSGSFMLLNTVEYRFGLSPQAADILAVIIGFAGLALQCYIERKELKETLERLKNKIKKLKDKKEISSEKN